MAKRNTFREDEELEEQINLHDILRIGVYLKPYMSRIVRILAVVVMMSCIAVVVPYLTKIMIDSAIPSKNLTLLGELTGLMAVLIVMYEFGLRYRTVEITRVGQLMLKDMRRDIFHAYSNAAVQLFRFASARQNPDSRGQLCEHPFRHVEFRSD